MASKDNSHAPHRLLTLQQTADVLSCSVKTLRRRIADGLFPVIRDGRIIRVRPEDLERYIRSRRFG